MGEEGPVDERQGVDVGGEMPAGARAATGDGRLQDRVGPHDRRKIRAVAVVGEEFGDAGLGFAQDKRLAAALRGSARISAGIALAWCPPAMTMICGSSCPAIWAEIS
ncbi:MAG: hypothetical protein ACRDP6_26590 [Actinoallomurus sp.]